MNTSLKSPHNENDVVSNEADNISRNTNRNRFFYISSNSSWQVKHSVGCLQAITGILEIINCKSNTNLSENEMKKKKNTHQSGGHFNQALNKWDLNYATDCEHSAGKMQSKRNSPNKTSSCSTITKFKFKEPLSDFDPSQDIFGSDLRRANSYHSELSSVSEGGKSQNTPEFVSSCESKQTVKASKKKKNKDIKKDAQDDNKKHNKIKLSSVKNYNDDNLHHLSPKRTKLKDIAAENLSWLVEEVFSESSDETSNKNKMKLSTNSAPDKNTLFSLTKNTVTSETKDLNDLYLLTHNPHTGLKPNRNPDLTKNDVLDNGYSKTELSLTSFVKPVKKTKDKKEKDINEKSLSLKRKMTFDISDAVGKYSDKQNYCDTMSPQNNNDPYVGNKHSDKQKIPEKGSLLTLSERNESSTSHNPENLNYLPPKKYELNDGNSEMELSTSPSISPAKKSKKNKKGKYTIYEGPSVKSKSLDHALDSTWDESVSKQHQDCNGVSPINNSSPCFDSKHSDEQNIADKGSHFTLGEKNEPDVQGNSNYISPQEDEMNVGNSEIEECLLSPKIIPAKKSRKNKNVKYVIDKGLSLKSKSLHDILDAKSDEGLSKQQKDCNEASSKDNTNTCVNFECTGERNISDKDSNCTLSETGQPNHNASPADIHVGHDDQETTISPAKERRKNKKGNYAIDKGPNVKSKSLHHALDTKWDVSLSKQQEDCNEASPEDNTNTCVNVECTDEHNISDKDSNHTLSEGNKSYASDNQGNLNYFSPKEDELNDGHSDMESPFPSISPAMESEKQKKRKNVGRKKYESLKRKSTCNGLNAKLEDDLSQQQGSCDEVSPKESPDPSLDSKFSGEQINFHLNKYLPFEFVGCDSVEDNEFDGFSETESPNRSDTPVKKVKKQKTKKAKHFEVGSSQHNINDRNDETPFKKKKIRDKISLKGSTKTCLDKVLNDQETLDPEWKPPSNSDTDSSSTEQQYRSQRSKSLKKTSPSKNQLDFKRKKKPTLFSSTPFPSRKKVQDNHSKTSQNSSNGDRDMSGSMILEEIQCSMISSEQELESLKSLNIDIDWELSPLHEIDTGSAKLTAEKLREKLGPRQHLMKESKYTEHEEAKIRQSWEEFSQKYGFSKPDLFFPSVQNYGIFSPKERHNFKLFLAKYLPERRLLSVYNKFHFMYGCPKKGRWSDKEDRLLLKIYYACKPQEHQNETHLGLRMKTMMSKALERTIKSVESRLNILLANDKAKTISYSDVVWTPELEGALIHRLVKKSCFDSIEDLRYATISCQVWRQVASKLGLNLNVVVNHWKYYLYPQLYAHQPVLRHILQIELIKWLYNSEYKDYKSIDWSVLSRRAGDLGSCYLYRVFRSLVNNFVPKQFQKNFRESVTFLYEETLERLKNKETSQMLVRKVYNPETRTLHHRIEDEEDCIPFRIK